MCTKYTKLFFKTEAINLKKWRRGGKTKREKRERKKCCNYNLKKVNFYWKPTENLKDMNKSKMETLKEKQDNFLL